jgi:uncharacterized membrane protein HdeD (DUF308 family)
MLKQNESSIDRIIRIIIGIVAISAGFFWLTGPMQTVTDVIGVIALVTGIIGFCGLYKIFGISTCPVKKNV